MSLPTLIWLQSSPYNSGCAREALDYILALAAVDCPAQLLLSGPAVCLLQPHPDFHLSLQLKDCSHLLGLFDLYDLPAPLVCQQSLLQYQLDASKLKTAAIVVNTDAVSAGLQQFSRVVTF